MVELARTGHLLEHVQDSRLTLVDKLLNFALGDDLKLRRARKREAGALEQVLKVLPGDELAVDVVLLSVSVAIVGLADHDLVRPQRYSLLRVVEGDFDPVGVRVSLLRGVRLLGSLPLLAEASLLCHVV